MIFDCYNQSIINPSIDLRLASIDFSIDIIDCYSLEVLLGALRISESQQVLGGADEILLIIISVINQIQPFEVKYVRE